MNTAELEALIRERKTVETDLRQVRKGPAGEVLERRRAEIDDAVRSAMSHARRHLVATFTYLYPAGGAIEDFEACLRELGWHRTELPTDAWARPTDRGATFPDAVKLAHDEIERARERAKVAVRVSCKFVVNGVRVGSFKVLAV